MLSIAPSKIYISSANADMRKGIDGFASIVEQQFKLNPMSNAMCVFHNRHCDKIKLLYWDRDGYPIVFFDGIVFNSRKDGKIISKCVYSVLGINMDGQKEILGTWISENESASFYASICADLKNRGISDIFIACHDNLTGLCRPQENLRCCQLG